MPTSSEDVWTGALERLQLRLDHQPFTTWIQPMAPGRLDLTDEPATLVLRVPSGFHRSYVHDRFEADVKQALKAVLGRSVALQYEVDPDLYAESDDPQAASSNAQPDDAQRDDTQPGDGEPGDGEPDDASPSSARSGSREEARSSGESSSSPAPRSAPSNARQRPRDRAPETSGRSSERSAQTLAGTAAVGSSPNETDGPFHRSKVRGRLKPEYSFAQFVEGDSNELARSASVAVAEQPGETAYNPLFIYGDVGLGKTHLAQAIAHYAIEHETARHLCFVSSEQFTNEFVQAIQAGDVNQFSARYRQVDLLVVDDVQFFGGKEKTQEQFFHLFNDLHQQGAQIVLCADRPSREIDGIEDRLLSRFQWGLSADIQSPSLETRLAILQLKAEILSVDVDRAVLELIAQNVETNVRELEGALKQLSARAQLTDAPLTPDLVRTVLGDQFNLRTGAAPPKPERIMDVVAGQFGLSTEDLVERSRRQDRVRARQMAMYLCRELTDLSYQAIGLRFAGRDHSTVIHACKQVTAQAESDPDAADRLATVKAAVQRQA